MNKYFTKEESENIISLLKSNDIESIKLGFTLLETHPKFKNFKKLIPYNESKIYLYSIGHRYKKNNVLEEIVELKRQFTYNIIFDIQAFHREEQYLIKFIEKRTK